MKKTQNIFAATFIAGFAALGLAGGTSLAQAQQLLNNAPQYPKVHFSANSPKGTTRTFKGSLKSAKKSFIQKRHRALKPTWKKPASKNKK